MELLTAGAVGAAGAVPVIAWLAIKVYKIAARLRRNRKNYGRLVKAALFGAAVAYASVGAVLWIYNLV